MYKKMQEIYLPAFFMRNFQKLDCDCSMHTSSYILHQLFHKPPSITIMQHKPYYQPQESISAF